MHKGLAWAWPYGGASGFLNLLAGPHKGEEQGEGKGNVTPSPRWNWKVGSLCLLVTQNYAPERDWKGLEASCSPSVLPSVTPSLCTSLPPSWPP